MIRKVIIAVVVVILLAGLYVSKDTLETVAAMVLTARDLFSPSPAHAKPQAGSASADPAKPPTLSPFAQKFSNSLMVMEDGTPHDFDSSKLAGVKYWAFYYSASWCPPCRAFTPDLVAFYREFKPFHPEFELIFVNLDRSQDDMFGYMRSDSMPWPAIWYADIDNPELEAKKYCSPGIPCLVLLDNEGQLISSSFSNGQYGDPHSVIADIRAAVK